MSIRTFFCLVLFGCFLSACEPGDEIQPLPDNVFSNPLPDGVLQFTSTETNRQLRGVWTYFDFDGSLFTDGQLQRIRIGVRTPLNDYILGQDVGRTIEQYDVTENIEGDLIYQLFLTNEDGTSSSEILDEVIIRFEQ